MALTTQNHELKAGSLGTIERADQRSPVVAFDAMNPPGATSYSTVTVPAHYLKLAPPDDEIF